MRKKEQSLDKEAKGLKSGKVLSSINYDLVKTKNYFCKDK